MNDTLRIANDSLKVVLSPMNEAVNNSGETTFEDIAFTIAVLIVIAASLYLIVRAILSSFKESRELSYKHEKEMLELNINKEERKRLMEFCYNLSQKKESEVDEPATDNSELTLINVRKECWQIIKQMNDKHLTAQTIAK